MESSQDEHRRLWAALIVLLVWNVGMSMTLVGIFNDIEHAINDLRRENPRYGFYGPYKLNDTMGLDGPPANTTPVNLTNIDKYPRERP